MTRLRERTIPVKPRGALGCSEHREGWRQAASVSVLCFQERCYAGAQILARKRFLDIVGYGFSEVPS